MEGDEAEKKIMLSLKKRLIGLSLKIIYPKFEKKKKIPSHRDLFAGNTPFLVI